MVLFHVAISSAPMVLQLSSETLPFPRQEGGCLDRETCSRPNIWERDGEKGAGTHISDQHGI